MLYTPQILCVNILAAELVQCWRFRARNTPPLCTEGVSSRMISIVAHLTLKSSNHTPLFSHPHMRSKSSYAMVRHRRRTGQQMLEAAYTAPIGMVTTLVLVRSW